MSFLEGVQAEAGVDGSWQLGCDGCALCRRCRNENLAGARVVARIDQVAQLADSDCELHRLVGPE